MRISIREQLGLLVLFCSLMALMILALATWFQNRNFIISIRLSSLSLTASLKAAQLSSTLLLYESQTRSVSTRVLIQSALQRFYQGNNTAENWARPQSDIESALANGNLLLQASLVPKNNTNNQTETQGLLNVTSPGLHKSIKLPYANANGSDVYLGDPGFGYPPLLYPNLTYIPATGNWSASATFDDMQLEPRGVLILGPMVINNSFALISATTAVINNTSAQDILGWLTLILDASLLIDVRNSLEGLGTTGEVLVVGPDTLDNKFHSFSRQDIPADQLLNQSVRFVLPPINNASLAERHSQRTWPNKNSSVPFPVTSFPAVGDVWLRNNNAVNNAGAIITTRNEENKIVSVGYAQVSTPFVDWALIVEQSHDEVVSPINHLRDVVLICVFCTTAGLILAIFPLAHYSITPIRNLRAATSKTVEPYQPDDGASGFTVSTRQERDDSDELEEPEAKKEGLLSRIASMALAKERPTSSTRRRRTFRIPSKVPERQHWVTDELTELTSTFNEMSDELMMQYQRLEERVKERTAELERSKQAAEAANQSKTLFIANISHELKTPLNGILGLTTVCMNEDDMPKIRTTLKTIYKLGDLLLHLLTDLLTFSKNEVGQQLSIDESEFRLNDLGVELIPTFEKQAREGQIDLKVLFTGSSDAFGNVSEKSEENNYGPNGTGRVRDMCVWGDKNRILQVLMNFVSNGLKFTPANGSVTIRIRCIGVVEQPPESKAGSARKSSMRSQHSKRSSKKKVRTSESSHMPVEPATKDAVSEDARLSINVAGGTTHIAKIAERRRSMSPPPLNTKDLLFEFEVEDTGPGIPDEQQKMIFDPFVQGDLGLSKKYGGTGLGLSICAQLAGLMHGDISLDSLVGRGSRFTMKLPLRFIAERSASLASSRQTISKAGSLVGVAFDDSDQTLQSSSTEDEKRPDIPRIVGFTQPYVAKDVVPQPTQRQNNINVMKQAENEAVKAGRKVRVLVAEDNKINQEVVLRMLKLEEIYDVTIAKDGQEAFDRVRESMQTGVKFHLVFMDVQMPNVDGIQSTKLIRGVGFSAPIVALTAFAEKSNEDECMASGMDYFLAKPIKRPALKHVLKKYCATIIEEDVEVSPGSLPLDTDVRERSDDSNTSALNTSDTTDVSPMS